MADLSKLKRRGTLGAPPNPEEASGNLTAPEVAPAVTPSGRRRIDGRSLRKTGRTLQFATRVTEEFDDLLHRIAKRDGLKLVEVLEHGIAAYEDARRKRIEAI
jgi:hypothetical protein